MDDAKKEIRRACKEAHNYQAWRNPFGVWFVTLFDVEDKAFFEFQYDETFPAREKRWVLTQLEKIDERQANKKGEEKYA